MNSVSGVDNPPLRTWMMGSSGYEDATGDVGDPNASNDGEFSLQSTTGTAQYVSPPMPSLPIERKAVRPSKRLKPLEKARRVSWTLRAFLFSLHHLCHMEYLMIT